MKALQGSAPALVSATAGPMPAQSPAPYTPVQTSSFDISSLMSMMMMMMVMGMMMNMMKGVMTQLD